MDIIIRIISRENSNVVVDYSLPLNALCDNIAPIPSFPTEFKYYPSYCYGGWVWNAVNEGMLIIFAAFKGEDAVAIATLHWKDGGWISGFAAHLPGHDDAYVQVTVARFEFLKKHSPISVAPAP